MENKKGNTLATYNVDGKIVAIIKFKDGFEVNVYDCIDDTKIGNVADSIFVRKDDYESN